MQLLPNFVYRPDLDARRQVLHRLVLFGNNRHAHRSQSYCYRGDRSLRFFEENQEDGLAVET